MSQDNEFDRLWECALNLHRALHYRGRLCLSGHKASVEIEAIYAPDDCRTVASGFTPTEAVRYLIEDYSKEARKRIVELRNNAERQINDLNDLLMEANQDNR